LNIK